MVQQKLAKHLRRKAEVAAEHFLRLNLKCVVTRRAVRTQWQKVDFFGSDVVGKLPSGAHVYAQVTTGGRGCVSVRRSELEMYPWHSSDIVLLLHLVTNQSPDKGRLTQYWFRVEEFGAETYGGDREWRSWDESVRVETQWFVVRRNG